MIIKETTGEPFNIMVGGIPKTMKQHIETHKLKDEQEIEDFHDILAAGRDIICTIPLKSATYVVVRELVPSKIEVAS